MTQQPQAKYRHDYRAPDYQITDIDLTFDLDAQKTVVTAVSQAVRHGASDVPLRLNGEDLKLVSVHINDEPWTAWKEEEGALVISNLPERFTLKIVNEISPAANTALEGLYQSGDALCTQCEAEGFRHITYYLDRPDVLARFTTKIIADKTKYPFLLSNGNRVLRKVNWKMDVIGYSGRIHSRNRVTCLRWWLVILMYCAIPSLPALVVKWRWSCMSIVATLIVRRGQ
ncbi:hypothetical protein EIMP300_63820 [Escherichia coli]|uniref:Aminopeptidase N-like N-terminal domain-containing protein n=1 Tax=Escherichia coli TaxID=562 RepID=A0A8S0FX95_ECOLX|nr:hypothetical protein EIMP300_63820 [Escherichia coli]